MQSPGVQWLEKAYRHLIVPPEDFTLRYLDYACFEPTILAVAANDSVLLAASQDDVYARVAKWVNFEGPDVRGTAKSFFLRLLYGQARERLETELSRKAGVDLVGARARLDELDSRIQMSLRFKQLLEAEAERTGYVRTMQGNRRPVGEAQAYKALSYFLQGTGALIFKLALSRLFAPDSGCHLVIPMHDGFLCAFPSREVEDGAKVAGATMRTAFQQVTGADVVRVATREDWN